MSLPRILAFPEGEKRQVLEMRLLVCWLVNTPMKPMPLDALEPLPHSVPTASPLQPQGPSVENRQRANDLPTTDSWTLTDLGSQDALASRIV